MMHPPLFSITEPVVCARCSNQLLSPAAAAALFRDDVVVDDGFTDTGLRTRCGRLDVKVGHIGSHGRCSPADSGCLGRKIN